MTSIVARNIAPIAGIALLGWNATHMVVLYYVDTIVSIAVLFTLLFLHGKDMPIDLATVKGKAAVAFSVAMLAGVFAFVFAWPVIFLLGVGGGFAWDDRAFLGGLAAQLFAACTTFVSGNRELRGHADPEGLLKRRFGIVTMRWVATFMCSFFLPWGIALIVVYCAASIYYELKPPE